MKILLIEDDTNKATQLKNFFSEFFPQDDLVINRSYQSGLKSLMEGFFDVTILDMSLPNFDIKKAEDGYKFRKLGWLDILRELKRKKISTKVIIVTQFENFGEGNDLVNLSSLKTIMMRDYKSNYKGTVFYNAKQDSWKLNLNELVLKCTNRL